MKKSIFIVLFVILSLVFSCSYVFAENNNNLSNDIQNAMNNAGNAVQNTANNASGAITNGANDAINEAKDSAEKTGNNVKNTAENAGNTVKDYTATRTSVDEATSNNTKNWMNKDIWTWIIVGIITIVIVALIWYYASRNSDL